MWAENIKLPVMRLRHDGGADFRCACLPGYSLPDSGCPGWFSSCEYREEYGACQLSPRHAQPAMGRIETMRLPRHAHSNSLTLQPTPMNSALAKGTLKRFLYTPLSAAAERFAGDDIAADLDRHLHAARNSPF